MQNPNGTLDQHGQENIFRAARLCAPSLDRLGRMTFSCSADKPEGLSTWCDITFLPVIVPAIQAAHAAASQQGARELRAVDRLLDASLSADSAFRSRDAGHIAVSDFHAPKSERTLSRYLEAVGKGESPGHFATILAARAAVFHIPAGTALAAYAFIEMRCLRSKEVWPAVAHCLARIPASALLLRAA